MSDIKPVEITAEQKIKNLEYQIEIATNVLSTANGSISKLQNDLDLTQKYTIIPAIENLNKELVEITSRLIKSESKDADLLIKQAYVTGKLETLNETSQKNNEMLNIYNNLINQTNVIIQL